MLDDCGTQTLIYVAPLLDLSWPQHAVPCAVRGADVAGLFDRLRMDLWDYAPLGAAIETQMASAGIVDEVLSVAREVEADLIAVGVPPPRVTNRLLDFGLAATLLRRATCTVLASPAPRSSVIGRDRWRRYRTSSPPAESLGLAR
jgi:hypothetical protein